MTRPTPSSARSAAWDLIPKRPTMAGVRRAAGRCRACGLWRDASQTVWGEGPVDAEIMMVGEQPGDREDVDGRPFVGPAGKLLDRAMADAGLDRDRIYLTNVVKHFKFERRGKRRIHKKPTAEEVAACRPWLDTEIRLVRPRILVCLGATAAQALLGRSFRVTQHRGTFVPSDLAPLVTATVHPSSILRAPDETARQMEYQRLVEDLEVIARAMETTDPATAAG